MSLSKGERMARKAGGRNAATYFSLPSLFCEVILHGCLKIKKKKKPSKNQEEDTLTFRKSKGYE